MIGRWLLSALYMFILFGLCVGGFYAYAFLAAYSSVKLLPKESMFFCGKHGYISKTAVITFMETDYCPRCYNESLTAAERIDG